MGRELIRLCDGMERHGLVDYQIGVWEEEIISGRFLVALFSDATRADSTVVLTQCLDLLGTLDGKDKDGAEASTSAQHTARSQGSRNY